VAKYWRNSAEYKKWKNDCKERDGNKCVVTGHTKRLEVHHLNHSTYFKDQRLSVDNGVTVTRLVHVIFHIFIMKGYRKKCTKKDWDRFVYLFKYIRMISKII
jgi:hypothetical protein